MPKYLSLQILRAFAVWLVVGNHYMQMYFNYQAENIVSKFFVMRGGFGVDLFFVLSGFVMFLTSRRQNVTGSSFFVKRVMRIIPAYWFYTTIFLLVIALYPREFAYTDYNLYSLIASYLLIPSENPSGIGILPVLTPGWTLIFEFTFYSILAACLLITQRHAVALCFAIILIAPIIMPDGLTWSAVLGSKQIGQFLFGFIIGWYVHSPLATAIHARVSARIPFGLLIFAASAVLSGQLLGYTLLHRTIGATMLVLAGIIIEQQMDYSGAMAKFLIRSGNYSYSIYLCHVQIIGIYLHYTGRWLPWYLDMAAIIAIAITVHFTAATSYRYIEQGSYTRAIKSALLNLSAKVQPPPESSTALAGPSGNPK